MPLREIPHFTKETPILNMIFALMAIDFTTLMHPLKLVSLVYCLSLTYFSLGMCKAHYSMNTNTQLKKCKPHCFKALATKSSLQFVNHLGSRIFVAQCMCIKDFEFATIAICCLFLHACFSINLANQY